MKQGGAHSVKYQGGACFGTRNGLGLEPASNGRDGKGCERGEEMFMFEQICGTRA